MDGADAGGDRVWPNRAPQDGIGAGANFGNLGVHTKFLRLNSLELRGRSLKTLRRRRASPFRTFPPPDKKYIVESMSGGVGLIDCDNDGKLDIITVNGSTVERYQTGRRSDDHALSSGR